MKSTGVLAALVAGVVVFSGGCQLHPHPALGNYLFALLALLGALYGGFLAAKAAREAGATTAGVLGLGLLGALLGAAPLGVAAGAAVTGLWRSPKVLEGSFASARAMFGAAPVVPERAVPA